MSETLHLCAATDFWCVTMRSGQVIGQILASWLQLIIEHGVANSICSGQRRLRVKLSALTPTKSRPKSMFLVSVALDPLETTTSAADLCGSGA